MFHLSLDFNYVNIYISVITSTQCMLRVGHHLFVTICLSVSTSSLSWQRRFLFLRSYRPISDKNDEFYKNLATSVFYTVYSLQTPISS
jgi:hypothetical protein